MTSPHDAMAAELRRVREERDALRSALDDLLTACETDCGGPDMGDFSDDEAVAVVEGEGECALTFGHMRRARAALAAEWREDD